MISAPYTVKPTAAGYAIFGPGMPPQGGLPQSEEKVAIKIKHFMNVAYMRGAEEQRALFRRALGL